jgi:hypothetical protein
VIRFRRLDDQKTIPPPGGIHLGYRPDGLPLRESIRLAAGTGRNIRFVFPGARLVVRDRRQHEKYSGDKKKRNDSNISHFC